MVLHNNLVGVRGFLERDMSSMRTVAGEMTTQKNSSRRVVVVALWLVSKNSNLLVTVSPRVTIGIHFKKIFFGDGFSASNYRLAKLTP